MAVPGNNDALARERTRQPGCCDDDGSLTRDGAASWRVRTDGPEAPLVELVRRLHGRAPGREDAGRSSQRGQAPHRRRSLSARKLPNCRLDLPGKTWVQLSQRTAGLPSPKRHHIKHLEFCTAMV